MPENGMGPEANGKTDSLAPVIMVQGTGSGVGKSVLVAALCRILRRDGFRVAPFKAQNMSNNAAVTASGGEVGRAQALQALAAGLPVEERMNPVLLKPMADTRSEVVVMGKGRPEVSEMEWHRRRDVLWPVVKDALHDLRSEFDIVIAEGAGSPAETNLRKSDIVNMAVALEVDAPVLLVADIDKGGAFASLFGTWSIMNEGDRKTIRGFALNRFRGDPSLLHPAPKDLELRTGVPTVGVVPFTRFLLPEEDGAAGMFAPSPDPVRGDSSLPDPGSNAGGTLPSIRIGVVALPHASNIDDLDPLRAEPRVELVAVRQFADVSSIDAIILPGTRNTPHDLTWLWEQGIADGIRGFARAGGQVLGFCGGYQMLGQRVEDPHGVEGSSGSVKGLGLLDIVTEHSRQKDVWQVAPQLVETGAWDSPVVEDAYEIHHGQIVYRGSAASVWLVDKGRELGHLEGTVRGCHPHGVLTHDGFRKKWLDDVLGGGNNLDGQSNEVGLSNWSGRVDSELNRWADVVDAHLDVDQILSWVGLTRSGS